MGLAGAFSIAYIPRAFVVRNDAAATAANVLGSPLLFRFGIVSDLVNQTVFVLLVIVLYELFKDVNRRHARFMVALVVVQVSMSSAIIIAQIAPLVLLSGGEYLSVFDKGQIDSMVHGVLTLRGRAIIALGIYMGLWLVPLGALVYRSGFIPRPLGVLLIVAGCAYVVSTLTYFLAADYFRYTSMFMMAAAAAGELGIVGWLLIKGTRDEPVEST
jgi:hypothetical protein